MENQPIVLNDGTQLDSKIVKVMRTIRTLETSGSSSAYTQYGDNGKSYGAYQWNNGDKPLQPGQTPKNWQVDAKMYLGNSNAEMTPENQNKVAYSRIKQLKDEGRTPEEIDAIWNGAHKDAITGMFVHNSIDRQQKFRKLLSEQIQQTEQPMGVIPEVQNKDLLQKTGDIVNSIFPGKQVGESIGTLGGYLLTGIKEKLGMVPEGTTKQFDLSAPTPLQTAADVAQGALMIGTTLPGEAVSIAGKSIPLAKTAATGIGRVAQSVGMGATFSGLGSIAGGETNLKEIGKEAAIGGAIGGAAGITSEAINSFINTAPKRLLKSVLPKLTEEKNIDYAIQNIKLGSPEKMVDMSSKALKSYNEQISAVIRHPDVAENITEKLTQQGFGKTALFDAIKTDFPDLEMDSKQITKSLKTVLGTDAGLITKLSDKTIIPEEVDKLRMALGRVSFKNVLDTPEIRAGKDIAASAWKYIRNQLTTAEPELGKILDNYSKEIYVNKGLQQLAKKSAGKIISIGDWIRLFTGSSLGGIPGAVALETASKVASSPAVKIGAAKIISKTAPITKGITNIGKTIGVFAPGMVEKNK